MVKKSFYHLIAASKQLLFSQSVGIGGNKLKYNTSKDALTKNIPLIYFKLLRSSEYNILCQHLKTFSAVD